MKRLCSSITMWLLLAFALPGLAQTVTGTIRGTITDASGAIMAGADVTVTNTATAFKPKPLQIRRVNTRFAFYRSAVTT